MINKEKLVNLQSIGIIVMKQGWSPTPTDILMAYITVWFDECSTNPLMSYQIQFILKQIHVAKF